MNRIILISLLVAAILGVGCHPAEQQSTGAANDILIGVYAASSGSEAAFGQATVQGEKLAAEEINNNGGVLGRKIRLIIEDDQGKAEEAASVVTKLITRDNVLAVLGENSSNQSLAAAPICQAAKVPMISPSSTNPSVTKKGDYIFRVCFTDPYQGKAIAMFVRNNLQATTAAILRDNKNDYSVGLAEVIRKEFTSRGGTIVAEQSYSGGDSDFRPQLTAIKAANPQVLFIPGFYTEVGQIAIQARDLGITVPMVGGDGWDSPTVIQIGGKSVDGCYFSDHYFVGEPRPAVKRFVAEIRRRSGKDPDANSALGYDALYTLTNAIKRAGSLDRKAIRDQIAATKNYQGVSGVITMGPDRDPIKPVAMIKIDGGTTHFAGWIQP
ncbi:MAG TPA: ABC transporter substrate-binding protein [Thermoanaerobaculia bacterium]|jgi:branched-chain amino acid transport system substrate-binding protein|nr:ABC transporter substrate-binding protein [Thermoanaerobaculia bacterium]